MEKGFLSMSFLWDLKAVVSGIVLLYYRFIILLNKQTIYFWKLLKSYHTGDGKTCDDESYSIKYPFVVGRFVLFAI